MFRGAIDGFSSSSGLAVLSGWAYSVAGDARNAPSRYVVIGISDAVVETFVRTDIGTEENYGVRIGLSSDTDVLKVLFGISKIVAVFQDTEFYLPIWNKLEGKILGSLLSSRLLNLDAGQRRAAIGTILASFRPAAKEPVKDADLFALEVGLAAYDGSAIIGRNGHLFLSGGNNDAGELYQSSLSQEVAKRWIAQIKARTDAFASQGRRFLQIAVPEKQSVLGVFHPDHIEDCSPLLRHVTDIMHGRPYFLDVQSIFIDLFQKGGLEPYRKADTHLSFHGAHVLAEQIACWSTGRQVRIPRPQLEPRQSTGDLGNRFGIGNIVETALHPVIEGWEFAERSVHLIESVDPEFGHTGAMRHWTCADPLIDKSVVIFGNSIFERGSGPLSLSWWAARMFRETSFVWSSSVDFDYAAQRKADIVIAQTVERFMRTPPVK